MNPMDIQFLVDHWGKLGLQGVIQSGGKKKWKDFCVVDSLSGGSTLPCDWITFDPEKRSVSYSGPTNVNILRSGEMPTV